jgi:hypothetical protein
MHKVRTALGFLGVLGLFVWPILSLLVSLFHGFKPGGPQGGLSSFQGWFCALSLVAVSGYYIAVAGGPWNRRLLRVGAALHAALLIAIFMLITSTDGGFLIAPVILVGPLLWTIYAARISESGMP